MLLLVDTDAFCKLAVGGVLHDAARLWGVNLMGCRRLPALPYMLRRGRLRKVFGPDACDALIPVANMVPVVTRPSDSWLDRITLIQAIDPGEALMFAAAAEASLFVLTGDKRALRALKGVPGFPEALHGRIIVIEAVFLALCDRYGADDIRRRVQGLATTDKVIEICFSPGNQDPQGALLSFYRSLALELAPLVLWEPRPEGGA